MDKMKVYAAVVSYAKAYLEYDGGTQYGQSGYAPTHDGLTVTQA